MALAFYQFTALIKTDVAGRNAIANQALTVNISGGGLATIYSDAAGATQIVQPGAQTDSDGNFGFYAESGSYDIVSGGRTETVNLRDTDDLIGYEPTVASLKSRPVVVGDVVRVGERANGIFEAKTGLIANGFNIINSTFDPLVFFELNTSIIVNCAQVGASTSASGATNLAAIKTAIDIASPGDTLLIPASDSGDYTIDVSGGRSGAILINKRLNVRIEGKVKSGAGAAIGVNPVAIFNVSADNVIFSGGGSIIGDGTVNSVNTGTAATMPSLIYVSGDNFSISDIEIDTPYKIGVHLDNCSNANLSCNRFTGGPIAYTDTSYFAVRSDGGKDHSITANEFYPSATGGMYVNCLFLVSSFCLIANNIAELPYEKLAYVTGNSNLLNANIIIGNSGFVPGTNQQGTVGVALRCDGSNNKITNNITEYGGGAACRNGGNNEISNNTFLKVGSSGAAMFDATSSFDNNIIKNNIMTNGALSGVVVQSGILVSPGDFSNKRIDISGNTIVGFGIADPIANLVAWATSTSYTEKNLVKPTTPNGRYYIAATSGTSGATTPTHLSGTVSDGGVDWTAVAFGTTNASIQMDAPQGAGVYDECMIHHNSGNGGFRGIATNDLNNSSVSDNTMIATDTAFREDTGAGNQYRFNFASAPIEYAGLSVTSQNIVYAEGSITPVISDGTNNATMAAASANAANWTRVGRQVTVMGNCVTTSLGSVVGAIRITGLPFPAGAGAGNTATMKAGFKGGLARSAASQSVDGYLAPGTDYIDLYLDDLTAGSSAMQASEWSNTGNIAFEITYFV